MYNRLYNFLEKKEIIFSLQFGFRQKYSTTHALIELTDKIRHEIDKSKYVLCRFSNGLLYSRSPHITEKTRKLWCERNFKQMVCMMS